MGLQTWKLGVRIMSGTLGADRQETMPPSTAHSIRKFRFNRPQQIAAALLLLLLAQCLWVVRHQTLSETGAAPSSGIMISFGMRVHHLVGVITGANKRAAGDLRES